MTDVDAYVALGQEGGGGGCLLRVEIKGPPARGKGADLWAPGSPFPTFLTPADLIVFHFCLLRTPLGNMPAFPQMVSGFRTVTSSSLLPPGSSGSQR